MFVKLLASNINWAILGVSPDPPYPPRPLYGKGGPMGGQGAMNEGGDIMSLTHKCDMFLESP